MEGENVSGYSGGDGVGEMTPSVTYGGRGVSKKHRKSVMYYLNGPLTVNIAHLTSNIAQLTSNIEHLNLSFPI